MPGVALNAVEREEIRVGVEAGEAPPQIAVRLGRDQTTIRRELARNGGVDADKAVSAQQLAVDARARPKIPGLAAHPRVAARVTSQVSEGRSPYAIWVDLTKDPSIDRVPCFETLYQGDAGGALPPDTGSRTGDPATATLGSL